MPESPGSPGGALTVFVTGAAGFIGRALMERVADGAGCHAIGLVRSAPPADGAHVRYVRGDLFEPGTYREALRSADAVIHLAGLTGKAARREYYRVNFDATALLLRECAAMGIGRFVFVSSIAAGFVDTRHYHYALSKQGAEAVVAASGISAVIVRPTIVLGPGSPIGSRLRSLGAAPVVPVFGDGRTRIQPVHCDDLCAVLLDLARAGSSDEGVVEVGGPEVVTIENLLRRIHVALRGRDPRVLHLPAAPIRSVLAALERLSPALVPVTAGQLATFTNDGVATLPSPLARGHRFRTIDEMVAELVDA